MTRAHSTRNTGHWTSATFKMSSNSKLWKECDKTHKKSISHMPKNYFEFSDLVIAIANLSQGDY